MTNLVDEAQQRFEDSDPQLPFNERWRIALEPLVTENAALKAEVAEARAKAIEECATIAKEYADNQHNEGMFAIAKQIEQDIRSLSTSQGEQGR